MFDATDYAPYSGLVSELEEAGLRIESTGSDWCPHCGKDYDPQIVGWLGDLEIAITTCRQDMPPVWDMLITRYDMDTTRSKGTRVFRSDDRADMAMMVRALRDANKGKEAK